MPVWIEQRQVSIQSAGADKLSEVNDCWSLAKVKTWQIRQKQAGL